MKPLGAQLRRLRLERDLTQERLAELSGLNYKYIGRIELGKAEPGADVLVRLARALDVPIGQIFETILGRDGDAYRASPADLDTIGASLGAVLAIVERIRGRQPRPMPARASRHPRR